MTWVVYAAPAVNRKRRAGEDWRATTISGEWHETEKKSELLRYARNDDIIQGSA
jgi:hypothetical protein